MYVRGVSVSRGSQRSAWDPAASCSVRRPTRRGAAAPSPLTKAPIVTRAGSPSRSRTTAASRNPSPFGETVANRPLSPANAGPSLPTETSLSSCVVRALAVPPVTAVATAAASARAVTETGMRRRSGLVDIGGQQHIFAHRFG